MLNWAYKKEDGEGTEETEVLNGKMLTDEWIKH